MLRSGKGTGQNQHEGSRGAPTRRPHADRQLCLPGPGAYPRETVTAAAAMRMASRYRSANARHDGRRGSTGRKNTSHGEDGSG